jgi:hypothetical protein
MTFSSAKLVLCTIGRSPAASYAKRALHAPYVPDRSSPAMRCDMLINALGKLLAGITVSQQASDVTGVLNTETRAEFAG